MNMQQDGLELLAGYFDPVGQRQLIELLRGLVRQAPLYTPTMPRSGKPMSVRMTNMGALGWVTDKTGYRYQAVHPVTGRAWPAIPKKLEDLWTDVAEYPMPPQACLVNYYHGRSRMGLHQDVDERDFSAPVVSVSLGDSAVFRIGGNNRKDPTRSFKLHSGDVLVMGGKSRLRFHGVDRILPGTSTLLQDGGRLNLTLRRVG